MTVNALLATYSDYAYRSAVGIYVLAMILHLGEYARDRVAAIEAPRVRQPVLAGDDAPSGPIPTAGEPAGVVAEGTPIRRSRAERFGRTAVALTVLGTVLHAVSLVLRGAAVDRLPWGNMYEFSSAICLFAVLAWLLVLRRTPGLRPIGTFVLLPVVVLLFLAGTVLYVQAGPVMPALQSYWLAIHVTAASLSGGLLLVSGVASAVFLARQYSGAQAGLSDRNVLTRSVLPAASTVDRVAYRITVIAFPLWTFAIMTGAIWAEAAWGKFWSWDPKETVALVAWIVYACYLHARATAGWRNKAAWINVFGFAVMLFNLFFINLVTTGLHSYAGVG